VVSLIVKFVALVFVLTMDRQNAINFQLLGGIWILQTFPAVVFGLYTRWFHRWALLGGWAVGMVYGTIGAYNVVKPIPGGGVQHFAGSVALIPLLAELGYIALTSFAINVIVAVVLTFVFRALKTPAGTDATIRGDYFADEGDPRVVTVDTGPHEYSPSP